MTELVLIGIGTGNPEHLTAQGAAALQSADLILIPRKGDEKSDLADLRRNICDRVLTQPAPRIVEFDLPTRRRDDDYLAAVDDWHDAIAERWSAAMGDAPGRVAMMIWGDPSLYDSSLRIAARLTPRPRIRVIAGITALQALTAAHAIPINALGASFTVTTGRRLRETGWPVGCTTLAVMLDAGGAFEVLDGAAYDIWWGAYLGMENEVLDAGPLHQAGPRILETRAAARAAHGWIMDAYILRPRTDAQDG